MPALLEMCPGDVKEQMLMRLDEIGANYKNFTAKVVSYFDQELLKLWTLFFHVF